MFPSGDIPSFRVGLFVLFLFYFSPTASNSVDEHQTSHSENFKKDYLFFKFRVFCDLENFRGLFSDGRTADNNAHSNAAVPFYSFFEHGHRNLSSSSVFKIFLIYDRIPIDVAVNYVNIAANGSWSVTAKSSHFRFREYFPNFYFWTALKIGIFKADVLKIFIDGSRKGDYEINLTNSDERVFSVSTQLILKDVLVAANLPFCLVRNFRDGNGNGSVFCTESAVTCAKTQCGNGEKMCRNGGECVSAEIAGKENGSDDNFICICPAGFGGPYCEIFYQNRTCERDQHFCLNDGVCQLEDNEYRCFCPSGFHGTRCELRSEKCASSSQCTLDFECIDGICLDSRFLSENNRLRRSTMNDVDCFERSCSNGGTCVSSNATGVGAVSTSKCVCRPGFTGPLCQLRVRILASDPCSEKVCATGQRCINRGNGVVACVMTSDSNITVAAVQSERIPILFTEEQDVKVKVETSTATRTFLRNETESTLFPAAPLFPVDRTTGFTSCDALKSPCLNGAQCLSMGDEKIYCVCQSGYTGPHCENRVDVACGDKLCETNRTCQEISKNVLDCVCASGLSGQFCEINVNDCVNATCLNGGECVDLINGYTCQCPPAFTGKQCEKPLSLCDSLTCKNNGSCASNADHEILCRCTAGFTGIYCETDIDDCVNVTCPNGKACFDGVNSYECRCAPRFFGPDCKLQAASIDECAVAGLCGNGGTCVRESDGNYACLCRPGYTGRNCEREIDECQLQSNLCLNGGTCFDSLVGYECRCKPGYTGLRCDSQIISNDPCISDPCPSNTVCQSDQRTADGFNCLQQPRSTSACSSNPCKNGGNCVPSNSTTKFICVCPTGFGGPTCQVAVQHIEDDGVTTVSSPCDRMKHLCQNGGTCIVDPNGVVACACLPGFTGEHCDDDIDECKSETYPCQTNTDGRFVCVNTMGNFRCDCDRDFGGSNCNIRLTGCQSDSCTAPKSVCEPTFFDGQHGHYCRCPSGLHGENCASDSTVSFSGNSLIYHVKTATMTARNYTVKFRLRTTAADVLVAQGLDIAPNIVYAFFLKDGFFNFDFLIGGERNRKMVTFKSRKLNDGRWYGAEMFQNSSLVNVDLFDEAEAMFETRTFELRNEDGETKNLLPIFTTKFGGLKSGSVSEERSYFVGCMQDLFVDGERLISNAHGSTFVNVETGCTRTPQCENPNVCSGENGQCVDNWNFYACRCKRPFLPPNCSKSLTEMTFGYENNVSFVEIRFNDTEKKALETKVDLSMIIRTRAADGVLAYMGSVSRRQQQRNDGGSSYASFLSLEAEDGRLKVNVQFGTAKSMSFLGRKRFDDGRPHLIRVTRRENVVQGFIDDIQVFDGRLDLPFAYPLLVDSFYLGGTPSTDAFKRKRQIHSSTSSFAPSKPWYFKGTIRDVRLRFNDKNDVYVPLLSKHIHELKASKVQPFGVPVSQSNILEGTVSDDTCKVSPCRNNGLCTVTFNDYECACDKTFRGKNCTLEDVCERPASPCTNFSECHILEKSAKVDGFLCVSTTTTDIGDTTIFYTSRDENRGAEDNALVEEEEIRSFHFDIRTRSSTGAVFFVRNSINDFLFFRLVDGLLELRYAISGFRTILQFNATVDDGLWHRVNLTLVEKNQISIIMDEELELRTESGSTALLQDLLMKTHAEIRVGKVNTEIAAKYLVTPEQQSFKGCLREVRFGEDAWLFANSQHMTSEQIVTDSIHRLVFISNASNAPREGCHSDMVCGAGRSPCLNGATCEDVWNKHICHCPFGFKGEACEINIDDCVDNKCTNRATCVDGIGNYTCACVNGYAGIHCETDINECASSPCQNEGVCLDLVGQYQCNCTANYTGVDCEILILIDCSSNPCLHGGQCADARLPSGHKTFNCTCPPAFYGRACEKEINFCQNASCQNGGNCTSHSDLLDYRCSCSKGFTGRNCEENINECLQNPCTHGKCVDEIGSFRCECESGWNGPVCDEDVNECLQSSLCSGRSVCVNVPGSYACECPPYYFGNSCEIEGTCLKEPCVRGNCTQFNATVHRCDCPYGYAGDACETEINFCESNPCQNGATCRRFVGGFQCLCIPGFAGDFCQTNINECESNPCENYGVCIDGINGFVCNCTGTGYDGPSCHEDVDECKISSMCVYATACRNTIGAYNCSCETEYMGTRCDMKNPCHSNATHGCKNQGQCVNPRSYKSEQGEGVTYDCLCAHKFEGDLCQNQKSSTFFGLNTKMEYILGPLAGCFCLILIIVAIVFVYMLRSKRATHGTYSPSRQEMSGARTIQMGAMMKKPNEERLI